MVEANGDRRAEDQGNHPPGKPSRCSSGLALARRVALGPPSVFEIEMLNLVSMDRRRFARYVVGEHRTVLCAALDRRVAASLRVRPAEKPRVEDPPA